MHINFIATTMKKIIFAGFFVLFACIGIAQELNTIVFDEEANQDILIGYCNIEGFTSNDFNEWFQLEYDNFNPDIETLDQINLDNIEGLEITVVLGTWCSDSKREFPRFCKILEKIGFPFEYLTIIGVNRSKQAPDTHVSELNIELVPTFIFSINGKEIGRIIETPEVSLEKDFYKIILSLQNAAQ